MRIKISNLDKKFSFFIRSRDGWMCQRCFKKYIPPTSGLHASHFWGRANKSVRFDPENVVSLCFGCHQHFTANPAEHLAWFEKRLGERRYMALMIRKNKKEIFDPGIINIWLTEKLKQVTGS